MRTLIIAALVFVSAGLSGIVVGQNTGERMPARAADGEGRPPRWRPDQTVRFSAVMEGDKAILLDTVTGESWMLAAGEGENIALWKPIGGGPHAERRPRGERSPNAGPPSDDDGRDPSERREGPPADRPRSR